MSTTNLSATGRRLIIGATVVVVVVLLVAVGLVLREYGPGNMGNGFLIGAGLAALGAAIAAVRVTLTPTSTTIVERAILQHGDERDDAILTRSLAVVGAVSLPLTGVAGIALALGAPVAVVVALLLAGQIGVLVVAFVIINHRN
ncbi:hypothetical protein [Homoserinimonas sp. OAct 916]|uniref:hypothetical protein n=1 Tax=Homoserinimonas sp. OAct 916 TaxID=2211450 RepID=UPI000DBE5257|nr:hypothetical protein [Homoserinimonas sp. OAct 916]